MRNLQLCILSPIHPLSPISLEFPLNLDRDYLLVRLFLAFCALPWRIHIRSMILLLASFSLDYLLYFAYYSFSVDTCPISLL